MKYFLAIVLALFTSSLFAGETIVRVFSDTGNGRTALGSGVVIKDNLVLTVPHVVRGSRRVWIHAGQIKANCKIAYVCKMVAILVPDQDMKTPGVVIAPAHKLGEDVRLAGYGQGSFRVTRGHVIRDNWVEAYMSVSAQGRQGDSGGPIWSDRGLVSLVEGGDSTLGTMGPDTASIHRAVKQYQGCGMGCRPPPIIRGPMRPAPPIVARPPTIQPRPPTVACKCKPIPGPAGKDGPPGPEGVPGPPGLTGPPGRDGTDATGRELGFYYRVLDVNGDVSTPLTWMPVSERGVPQSDNNTLTLQKVWRN